METPVKQTKDKKVLNRKTLVPVIGIALLAIGISTLFLLSRKTDESLVHPVVRFIACDMFSQDDAQKVLGNGTLRIGEPDVVSSDTFNTTNCSYEAIETQATETTEPISKVATVTVASSNTETINEFNAKRLPNSEIIPGVGDDAFWNQDTGELHVLVRSENYRLVITAGQVGKIYTKDLAIEVAKATIN